MPNPQYNPDNRIAEIFGCGFVDPYGNKILSVLPGIAHLFPVRFQYGKTVSIFLLFIYLGHFHQGIVLLPKGFQTHTDIAKTAVQRDRYRKIRRIPGPFGQTEECFFQQ